MMKFNRLFGMGLVLTLVLSTNIGQAQCRGWVKRKCIPTVEDAGFKFSGQMSTAVLVAGETADLALSFNSGKTYRLLVRGQDILGDVTFKLMDKDRTLIYDSENQEDDFFDFKVESTQQLIVEIVVPESENTHDLSHHGCVTVIQGYK